MKNILLFGPPGIGKSTTIKKLQALGYKAFDLEELEDLEARLAYIYDRSVIPDGTFFWSADLKHYEEYSGCLKVLLILPEEEYIERRDARNKQYPEKIKQRIFTVEYFLKQRYDYIFTADEQLIEKLLKLPW